MRASNRLSINDCGENVQKKELMLNTTLYYIWKSRFFDVMCRCAKSDWASLASEDLEIRLIWDLESVSFSPSSPTMFPLLLFKQWAKCCESWLNDINVSVIKLIWHRTAIPRKKRPGGDHAKLWTEMAYSVRFAPFELTSSSQPHQIDREQTRQGGVKNLKEELRWR